MTENGNTSFYTNKEAEAEISDDIHSAFQLQNQNI